MAYKRTALESLTMNRHEDLVHLVNSAAEAAYKAGDPFY
jgi:hypothetical protein